MTDTFSDVLMFTGVQLEEATFEAELSMDIRGHRNSNWQLILLAGHKHYLQVCPVGP